VSKDSFYAGAGAGSTALVVDDNPRNRFALTVLLKRGGMTVLAAASGPAALEILEQKPTLTSC
jgi:CheY-like chemotaxis protein